MTAPDPFVQFIFFPWATFVDAIRRKAWRLVALMEDALSWAPPKTTIHRATVMQHIWAEDLVPYLLRLGITHVYWSHTTQAFTEWANAIEVNPFPLFPVACSDRLTLEPLAGNESRRYLYSFIGAYDEKLYITQSRDWIYALPNRTDSLVKRREKWHFEDAVYGKFSEVPWDPISEISNIANGEEYNQALLNSIFSLCPSGSGRNSIRIWESFGMGCIPVVLADGLRVPIEDKLWQEAVLCVNEDYASIAQLPELLERMRADEKILALKRNAGREIWKKLQEPNVFLRPIKKTFYRSSL